MIKSERIERRVKLHDVRVLMAAVETGSMNKAADRLGTSQPAISRSISDLEHALGVPLLERSPQGVEPTRYGRALAKRGLAVFDELRQGVEDIAFLADPTVGELRVGCSESFASGLVLDVIEKLARKHPRISFQLATGAGSPIFDGLAARNVEFVVSRTTEIVVRDYLVVDKLFDDSYVIAVGPGSRWERRRRIELAELVDEPWTLPPSDSFGSTLMAAAFRARGLEPPKATVTTPSLNMRNSLMASGRYLTMLPGFAITRHRFPHLKKLPVDLPDTQTPVSVVTLKNKALSPLALMFLDHLREAAKLRN